MKKKTMLLAMILFSAWCNGQTVVELDEAGSLEAKLSVFGTENIQSLKIKGDLNGTDIRYLRQLTGDAASVFSTPIVEVLDLSEADIVSGGEAYYEQVLTDNPNQEEKYFTEAHVLGDYMFAGCQWLKELILPVSTKRIGERCFLAVERLLSIDIPEGVKRIERQAFCNCSNLAEVFLPSTLLSVDAQVFDGCSSLCKVTCLSATPPAYGFKSFPSPETTLLIIKEAPYATALQNYSEADGWKNFNLVTTIVSDIRNSTAPPTDKLYDLQGRSLNGIPVRGLYIQNGRKQIVR